MGGDWVSGLADLERDGMSGLIRKRDFIKDLHSVSHIHVGSSILCTHCESIKSIFHFRSYMLGSRIGSGNDRIS